MMNQEQVIAVLKVKLATDPRWAARALVRIAQEQTADDLAKIEAAIEVMREELIEESACRFERATHA